MDQRANIIKSLRLMGYTVTNEFGIYSVLLITDGDFKICRRYGEEELIFGHGMLEKIVRDMNTLVIMNF